MPLALDLKLWILGGIIAAGTPLFTWLAIRETKHRDVQIANMHKKHEAVCKEMTETTKETAVKNAMVFEKLNDSINDLTVALKDMKIWSLENFVSRRDHEKAMAQI
ncbi:MAG: hypothetical protein FWG11_05735, partial [Promicromonosporaceae bacterium]|nr:hypothetical protein [Promicromonosporaceae bacterium]